MWCTSPYLFQIIEECSVVMASYGAIVDMVLFAVRLILLTGLAWWFTTTAKHVWYWVRARRMLSHLPRFPADSTLLGFPKEAVGPRRHIVFRGARPPNLAVVLCYPLYYAYYAYYAYMLNITITMLSLCIITMLICCYASITMLLLCYASMLMLLLLCYYYVLLCYCASMLLIRLAAAHQSLFTILICCCRSFFQPLGHLAVVLNFLLTLPFVFTGLLLHY